MAATASASADWRRAAKSVSRSVMGKAYAKSSFLRKPRLRFKPVPLTRAPAVMMDGKARAMTLRFVDTALLRVGFEVGGAENGFPVILAHGWPDDARTWDR